MKGKAEPESGRRAGVAGELARGQHQGAEKRAPQAPHVACLRSCTKTSSASLRRKRGVWARGARGRDGGAQRRSPSRRLCRSQGDFELS